MRPEPEASEGADELETYLNLLIGVGIGIYLRHNYIDGIEIESTDESIVWLRLKSTFFGWDVDRLIACIYFTPANSSYIHNTNSRVDYFNILLEQVTTKNFDDTHIFLCGDFNSRTGLLNDQNETIPGSDGGLVNLACPFNSSHMVNTLSERNSADTTVNEYGKNLIQFCKSTGFRIVNGRVGDIVNTGSFTCYKDNGASVVDYIICKPQSMNDINCFEVLSKRVESDHTPLSFCLKVSYNSVKRSPVNPGLVNKNYIWDRSKIDQYHKNFHNEDCRLIKENLLLSVTDSSKNAEQISEELYDYLNTAIKGTFRQRTCKEDKTFPTNAWFNSECKKIKSDVHKYAKEHDISRSPFAEEYLKLEKEYNRIRQKYKRQYQTEINNKLENFYSKNPSAYWKLWKSLKHKKTNNSKLTLNDFEEYFTGQIRPPDTDYFDHEHMDEIDNIIKQYETGDINTPNLAENINTDIANEICNGVITEEEIKWHLRKLKNNKAAGSDNIIGEFLKYAPDNISQTLFTVFNYIFDNGKWPSKWAEGLINPVHKKGTINSADNYRKITVMPAIGKVLESILNSRLVHKNLTLELDDPYQFGFKANSRTTDNIFILQAMVMRHKFKNKPLYVCFVDFTKAFDYVNRNALYQKLIRRGVNGKLLNLLCDMYKQAKCRVKWKGQVGVELDSEYGVLQGGMLSPKLFTEFLYDLKQFLDNEYGVILSEEIMTYILYADDMILCSDSPEGLQKLIDGLYKFCSKWHLIVSLAKTNVMIFGKKQTHDKFMFGVKEIKIVTHYNYLGTIFSTNTRDMFKLNYTNLSTKANNAIYALKSHAKMSIGKLQPKLAIKMFEAQISPILEYASEIWFSNKEIAEHERLHLAYLKDIIKVKPSSSTLAIYAEFGRFPMTLKYTCKILKYWKRILELDGTHPVKSAYNSLLELNDLGQTNWCTHVKHILYENQLAHVWEAQQLDNNIMNTLIENIYKRFMDKCMQDVNNSEQNPKLRTYKLFKTEFKQEPYLNFMTNPKHAYALARFRISSHNLRVETGRYVKPKIPIEDRICLYCTSHCVEDERHFLLKCTLYNQERADLINVSRLFIPQIDELDEISLFNSIMSSCELPVVEALGKYIYSSLDKRYRHCDEVINIV